MSGRTLRYILIGGLVLAIGVPSVAMGFGEGRALILGKRNPSGHRTLTKETQIIGNVSTYATRQSNKKVGDGGGAIYGCRSDVGHEPCILTRNLRDGRAFQFETSGKEGGYIKRPASTPTGSTAVTGATSPPHRTRCSPPSTPTARWPPAAPRRPARAAPTRPRRPTRSRSTRT
jgi:hypothetical protein